jgi:predicted enzyme related to lactoylglutathione lyase
MDFGLKHKVLTILINKADDPQRAKNFYAELIGWKFERPMEEMEYFLILSRYGVF